ncbi:hypothetical protein CDAR_533041 [Caerostris darwini]|uniref:Uncharacterized protein n=1 Tax=Caerostris darwini TaxID=1538125 RepID=A0AAV4QVH5_9ARAC|nr:hypothetical protein CDAR_533041 [Caerostris darwini]
MDFLQLETEGRFTPTPHPFSIFIVAPQPGKKKQGKKKKRQNGHFYSGGLIFSCFPAGFGNFDGVFGRRRIMALATGFLVGALWERVSIRVMMDGVGVKGVGVESLFLSDAF